jgi:hypothetical protein
MDAPVEIFQYDEDVNVFGSKEPSANVQMGDTTLFMFFKDGSTLNSDQIKLAQKEHRRISKELKK